MEQIDKQFTGSIPQFYDKYLVPLIFESFAKDLALRAASSATTDLLELAAGSGVVTRELTEILGKNSKYRVTDINQAMLDHAKMQQEQDDRITWQQADALNLPFLDNTFDTVICQFGVMFFPDKIAGYHEAKRVLKPNGRFIFSVWDRIEENEFAHIVTEVAAISFPDNPPNFLARTPHGYHNTKLIKEELSVAGFSKINITTINEVSIGDSASHPAVAYCQGTPLRAEIEARDASLLDHITTQATKAIQSKFGVNGPVEGKIRGHVIEASY